MNSFFTYHMYKCYNINHYIIIIIYDTIKSLSLFTFKPHMATVKLGMGERPAVAA